MQFLALISKLARSFILKVPAWLGLVTAWLGRRIALFTLSARMRISARVSLMASPFGKEPARLPLAFVFALAFAFAFFFGVNTCDMNLRSTTTRDGGQFILAL